MRMLFWLVDRCASFVKLSVYLGVARSEGFEMSDEGNRPSF